MIDLEKYKDFEIREYKGDNFLKIRKLFTLSFKRDLSFEYWDWKHNRNPIGKTTAFLMFDGDILIGYYGVDASILNYKGTTIKSALSSDTMTHPDYRGLGIFPTLAELTYNKLAEDDVILVYGFPNIYSHLIFQKKLNWVKFNSLSYIYKDLAGVGLKIPLEAIVITKIDKFGEEINNFFEEIKNSSLIFRTISKEILNWRFHDNPIYKYDLFLVREQKSNDLISYFISKTFNQSPNEIIIDLVDYYIKSKNLAKGYKIFINIQDFLINFYSTNCSKLMTWVSKEQILNKLVTDANYKYVDTEAYFGFRFLKKVGYIDQFHEFYNWHLTMGHSDIF